MRSISNNNFSTNLKMYILNGILYTIMLNLYSPFTVKFLERIGGSEFDISLYNALPGLVAVFSTLPGTFLIMKYSNNSGVSSLFGFTLSKKKVTAILFFLSRLCVLLLAFVPLLPEAIMPIAFVLIYSLRNFPDSVSQTALQGFTGDLFSPEERTTAISLRSKYSIPASLIMTFIAGRILSVISSNSQIISVYQLFFIIAFVIGITETIVFLLIKEPKIVETKSLDIKLTMKLIFKDSKFLKFTKISLPFYFSWQMGWPIFNIYQVITLQADEWWLCLIAILNSLGMFLGYKFWNNMIYKRGNHFVICVATLGMAVNPLIMAVSPNLYFYTLLNLPIGFFTAGTVTVLLSYLLEVTPEENRVIYIGTYNTLVNVSLAISPFVSHFVLKRSDIFISLVVVAIARFLASAYLFLHYKKSNI